MVLIIIIAQMHVLQTQKINLLLKKGNVSMIVVMMIIINQNMKVYVIMLVLKVLINQNKIIIYVKMIFHVNIIIIMNIQVVLILYLKDIIQIIQNFKQLKNVILNAKNVIQRVPQIIYVFHVIMMKIIIQNIMMIQILELILIVIMKNLQDII